MNDGCTRVGDSGPSDVWKTISLAGWDRTLGFGPHERRGAGRAVYQLANDPAIALTSGTSTLGNHQPGHNGKQYLIYWYWQGNERALYPS